MTPRVRIQQHSTRSSKPVTRFRIPIDSNADVARAVIEVRSTCVAAGMDESRGAQLGTAVAEVATNVIKYANNGNVDIRRITGAGRVGVKVIVVDEGPGSADFETAMRDHFRTGDCLGLGLASARRLIDEMRLDSPPGVGTRFTMRKWG